MIAEVILRGWCREAQVGRVSFPISHRGLKAVITRYLARESTSTRATQGLQFHGREIPPRGPAVLATSDDHGRFDDFFVITIDQEGESL